MNVTKDSTASHDAVSAKRTPIIQMSAINKDFAAGEQYIRVLHDIDLNIYQGEMVAIIGQSGSGKSTLMNIIGCLDKATTGDYRIFGKSVQQLDADELARLRREHFGFVFQRYHLLGDLTAKDNVAVPAVYIGVSHHERRQRATNLLTDLGMADKTENRPSQLSGGQQQRVSIARALMNGGDIILADEPTGALDSQSGEDVMQILHELNRAGHTIIMVTHDPNLAKQAARVIEIKDGHIITDHHTQHQHPSHDHAEPSQLTPAQSNPSQQNPQLPWHSNQKTGRHTTSTLAYFDRLAEAFKMSLLAMSAHKMRTLLTMLGIIIGIASVVSIVGLGQGSQQQILSDISSLGTNTIRVIDGYPWGDPRRRAKQYNLTPQDAQAVADQPYVISVSPVLEDSSNVRYGSIQAAANINGVGVDHFIVTGEHIAQGRGFDNDSIARQTQDVIIDNDAKKTFFPDTDNPVGEVIMIGNIPSRIIAVLAPKTSTGFAPNIDSPTIYMPYTTMMSRVKGTSYIQSFIALLDDHVPTKSAEAAIYDVIEARHGTDDFRIVNADSIRQTIESTTNTMTLLISSIAVISLIVGGIGVMNIMLVSVTERTNEIGVRMAVGARQSDILQQFLIEAILVCLLGGMLGIMLAFAIGETFNHFASDFKVVYSPTSIIIALLCCTAIGVLFGFLPARNAAKLDPVEALSRD